VVDYRNERIPSQYEIMRYELRSSERLYYRATMWDKALDELQQSEASLAQANATLLPNWDDPAGKKFEPMATAVHKVVAQWRDNIVENDPARALLELATEVRTTYGVVKAAYDTWDALTRQQAALRQQWAGLVDAANAARSDGPMADRIRNIQSNRSNSIRALSNAIADLDTEIHDLQMQSGSAVNALADKYQTTGFQLRLAAGNDFPQLPRPAGAAASGVPYTGGAGAIGPDGLTLPGDAALPDGLVPAGLPLPAEIALPEEMPLPDAGEAGGADLPDPGDLGGADGLGGLGGLDPAAEPALSGLGGAGAPTLPPGLATPPGGLGLPGTGGIPSTGTPTLPPFVPPVLPPGIPGTGSGLPIGSRGGGVPGSGLGAGRVPGLGPGGGSVPGLGLGGGTGTGTGALPQTAVPVNAIAEAGPAGPAPVAPARLTGTPAAISPAAGGIPPMMPPMMGAGAPGAGGGGKPGSGATRRPPAGRGRATASTPGLPALLSGKAGRTEATPVPVRSHRERTDRTVEPPIAVQVVDEDLWRVDDTTDRANRRA
jgi:hypothetical protein